MKALFTGLSAVFVFFSMLDGDAWHHSMCAAFVYAILAHAYRDKNNG